MDNACAQPQGVLVIDDDPTFNRVLCRVLSQCGFEARGALDGGQALVLASAHRPPCMVLDLNLDGASGLKLIQPLLEIVPQARIVVLTGYASIATAVQAVKLGAVQYLAKPAEADALVRALLHGDEVGNVEGVSDEPMSVDRLEWEHLQRVLAEHDGNISATARALKMHRRTLQRKLARPPEDQP